MTLRPYIDLLGEQLASLWCGGWPLPAAILAQLRHSLELTRWPIEPERTLAQVESGAWVRGRHRMAGSCTDRPPGATSANRGGTP